MYEVIFEFIDGSDKSLVSDSYASAWNTFVYYGQQLSLFGLFRVMFVDYEMRMMVTAL